MKTSGIFIYGIVIQIIGIGAGFAFTTSGVPFGQYLAGLITVVLVALFLAKALKINKWSKLIVPTIVWSLSYVIILQTLGFLWFPGLVKDLEPFSIDHLIRSGTLFVIQVSIYLGVLGVCSSFLQSPNED